MGINVNNIIEFTFTWRDTRWQSNVKNVLHYRGFTGELSSSDYTTYLTAFATNHWDRLRGMLDSRTSLRSLRMINKSNATDPAELIEFDAGELPGGQTGSGLPYTPQASACIVRQAWSRGRKSLGRTFFGPLMPQFLLDGEVVVDPLGDGDLQDVLDNLGDPYSALGLVIRPIICGASDTIANAGMDVRSQRVSRLAVFMKSRRLNVGE